MSARALVLALVCIAAPARADRAKAEQYFQAGAEAFKQQNFAAAAENFEHAYKELALPQIAFSAAQAYRRQFFIDRKPQYVQRAVELYEIYLAAVKTGGRVADAADGLAEMKRELEALDTRQKHEEVHEVKTRIAISIAATGEQRPELGEIAAVSATDSVKATATLDGKPIDLYAPTDVTPGEHTVVVDAAGYFPVTIQRRAVEGASDVWVAELKPRPAQLSVVTEDGATVAIDGKLAGSVPLATQPVPAGKHVITVTRRGREAEQRDVVLSRGESKKLEVALVRTTKRRSVPWLIGGAGALALGAVVFTPLAISEDHDMSSLESKRMRVGLSTSELQQYRDDASRRDTFRDLAFGLGGAAIAVGATAAALYYFDVPVAPTGTGVAVVGTF